MSGWKEGSFSASVPTEIMMATVVVLLIVFVLWVYFYHLRAKRQLADTNSTTHSSRDHFSWASDQGVVPRRGLDRAVIKALPVTVFRSEDFEEGLECAVCLSELCEGERARLLPKCNHGFHLECIDVWFRSNTTCPICRSPVCSPPSQSADLSTHVMEVSENGNSTRLLNFPANVLVWGSGNRVSTGVVEAVSTSTHQEISSSAGSASGMTEGMLVIEIPSPNSASPSDRITEEEIKSSMSASWGSVEGVVSRESRGIDPTCSREGGDIEQEVGVVVAIERSLSLPK